MIEKGYRVTFKGSIPGPGTQGTVLSYRGGYVFGLLDNGNYFREKDHYVLLSNKKPVSLGFFRKCTENLPDHTYLLVDNQYLCSVLQISNMNWKKEDKDGKQYDQYAVIVDNTMKNVCKSSYMNIAHCTEEFLSCVKGER